MTECPQCGAPELTGCVECLGYREKLADLAAIVRRQGVEMLAMDEAILAARGVNLVLEIYGEAREQNKRLTEALRRLRDVREEPPAGGLTCRTCGGEGSLPTFTSAQPHQPVTVCPGCGGSGKEPQE